MGVVAIFSVEFAIISVVFIVSSTTSVLEFVAITGEDGFLFVLFLATFVTLFSSFVKRIIFAERGGF